MISSLISKVEWFWTFFFLIWPIVIIKPHIRCFQLYKDVCFVLKKTLCFVLFLHGYKKSYRIWLKIGARVKNSSFHLKTPHFFTDDSSNLFRVVVMSDFKSLPLRQYSVYLSKIFTQNTYVASTASFEMLKIPMQSLV